jgi:hypothetical protein
MKPIMQDMQDIKLECAQEIKEVIISLCLEGCESPQQRTRLKIGSYLGLFATTLRSVLNFTVLDYLENRLKPRILAASDPNDNTKYDKAIKDSNPTWSENRSQKTIKEFYRLAKPVMELTDKYDQDAFRLLEKSQIFQPDNDWFWVLSRLSNIDKHELITECIFLEVTPINPLVEFKEKQVRISGKEGVEIQELPCYFASENIFISTKQAFYLILFQVHSKDTPGKREIPLSHFLDDTPAKVAGVIREFNNLS